MYVRLRYIEFQSLVKELCSLLIANHQILANLINKTILQTISNSALKTLVERGRCFGGSYAEDYDSVEPLSTEVRLLSSDEPESGRSLWFRTVERPILWSISVRDAPVDCWFIESLNVNEKCFENHQTNRIIFLPYYFSAVYEGLTR